jgi:hypothetical protein
MNNAVNNDICTIIIQESLEQCQIEFVDQERQIR